MLGLLQVRFARPAFVDTKYSCGIIPVTGPQIDRAAVAALMADLPIIDQLTPADPKPVAVGVIDGECDRFGRSVRTKPLQRTE